MKKINYKLLLIILFIAIIPLNVSAKNDCSDITNAADYYNSIVEEMEDLNCDDVYDSEYVSKCNDYNREKSLTLSKIFSIYYDDNIKCNKGVLKKIVEDNKKNCTNVFGTELKDLANNGYKFFYVVAPFLLIIFGSIDFSKIVVMNDPKTIKESRKKFFRRLINFLLILILPAILNFILKFNASGIDYNSNIYSCKNSILFHLDKWETTYIPPSDDGGGGGSTPGVVVRGGITTDAEAERLNQQLNSMLNTRYHTNYEYQNGPFPKWWKTPTNDLEKFQCTWWANGRASQYLESHGTKYKSYPTQYGDGGMYYDVNKQNGYFNYGPNPKPNSIISWRNGSYGHVAYVEGVGQDGIYISHAGGGRRWFGVQKIPLDGSLPWSGYVLNGYIYLNEPK